MVMHVTEILSCAFDPSHDRLHGVKEPSRHGVTGTIVVRFAKHAKYASCYGLIFLWIRGIS